MYIYISNETPNVPVFFDNLQVTHIRGPLLEETHYYPFGLTMAGISSKALNGVAENKKKFNGIEQNTDFDLNMYDAFYRNLDPQIGRFWQIDPKLESTEAWSPYAAMLDNPVRYADPLGDSAIKPQAVIPTQRVNEMQNYFFANAQRYKSKTGDDCIICHNKGMKIATGDSKLSTGSTISETREKMQKSGNAGPAVEFGFNDKDGKTAKSAPQAEALKSSIGEYIAGEAASLQSGQSAVYGVSIMDGYHSMTLSVSVSAIPANPIIGTPEIRNTTITLSDQGTPLGTIGRGNLNLASPQALDAHLTTYVKRNSDAVTRNQSPYPAKIELHPVYTKQ